VVWDLCVNYPTNLRGDQCTRIEREGQGEGKGGKERCVVDPAHNYLYESYQATLDTGSKSISITCGVGDLCANYSRGDQCTR
jgi:hypothetical protein